MEHQPSTLSNQPRPSKRFVIVSWALVAAWAFLIFFMSSNTGTGLNTGLGIFSSIYRAMQPCRSSCWGLGWTRCRPSRTSASTRCSARFWPTRCAATCRCVVRAHRHRLCQLVRGERRGSSTVRARAHVRPGGLDGGYCGQRAVPGSRTRCCEKEMPALSKSARVAPQRRGSLLSDGRFRGGCPHRCASPAGSSVSWQGNPPVS